MAWLPVCVMVAIIGVSGTAAAQLARYPRQQPAPPAAVFSDRVGPLVTKPVTTPAVIKPTIGAEDVLSIDGLRGAIRGEQEQILVQLIENTPDSDAEEKADYYFRLGELYAKQQRFWRLKSAELASAAPGNAAKQSEARLAAEKTKEYLLRTVKTFKGLTDNDAFRSYPKMDVALFYYAYSLQSGKYMKEARSVYDKLLKDYPQSLFVPEAHLAFADYYYDAGQLADAEARYKSVLEFPKSSVYAYALYRLGWIDLQLTRPQEALEAFSRVVSATRSEPKQTSLYRAARSDFARAYLTTAKPEQAFAAFHKLDSQDATDLLELFADAAWEGGSPDRVVAAYRELASRTHGDGRACQWQYRIARATLWQAGTTNAGKVKEIDALVHLSTDDKQTDDECRADAAAMSGEVASALFSEWSKTQNAETLGYAERLYTLHVAAFAEDDAARAQYAEVLWARADHETNTKVRKATWQRTAETFATLGTLEGARAAALAWMNAADVVVPSTATLKLARAARSSPRALPLAAVDAKLVASITDYEQLGPADDDELAEMRLAAAITLRRYRHLDEAASALDAFLEHHQTSARAEIAANLLLDTMIQRGKMDETLGVVDAMAADGAFIDGKPELLRNLQLLRSATRVAK